jgi:hypothetical protein
MLLLSYRTWLRVMQAYMDGNSYEKPRKKKDKAKEKGPYSAKHVRIQLELVAKFEARAPSAKVPSKR